ncbi:MAG: glycosyltransferase family 4 protein [Bacteroidales bacterium]|nr:glycosyltransferase family 4 protein [Bacteroidales bacterium]
MAAAIEKYSDGKRCEVIPIWTDNEFLKPVPADKNPFITEYNLQKKFIVLYSGSIGESSGVDYLVEAASTIDNKNILFLIIGEGSKKQAIYKKIKVLGLDNCVLLPWQEVSVLPYSLASANLAVVTLSGKSSNHAIPSKLFNYMSVGSPILCLADPESDLGKLVTEEGIGKCFDPEMKREIAGFILQIFNNPEEARMFGNNALKASKKYTSDNVNRFLMSIK